MTGEHEDAGTTANAALGSAGVDAHLLRYPVFQLCTLYASILHGSGA